MYFQYISIFNSLYFFYSSYILYTYILSFNWFQALYFWLFLSIYFWFVLPIYISIFNNFYFVYFVYSVYFILYIYISILICFNRFRVFPPSINFCQYTFDFCCQYITISNNLSFVHVVYFIYFVYLYTIFQLISSDFKSFYCWILRSILFWFVFSIYIYFQ